MDPLGKFNVPLKESPEQRSMGVLMLAILGRGLMFNVTVKELFAWQPAAVGVRV
jgi:hypothetical protein